MQAFTVTGVQQGTYEPQLVTSKEVTNNVNLLNVVFETNPLGKVFIYIIHFVHFILLHGCYIYGCYVV